MVQKHARGYVARKLLQQKLQLKVVSHGQCMRILHRLQAAAVPLLLGIVIALLWANVDYDSYVKILGTSSTTVRLWPGAELFGHPITIHYVVNDVFMVFFFGIAAKEVTESCLPGGSLNPPRKALAPLLATLGGVVGPVTVYIALTYAMFAMGAFDGYQTLDGGSGSGSGSGSDSAAGSGSSLSGGIGMATPITYAEIRHGWGVPCATDISLAWVVATLVFPSRHPATDFLLLLAVADDAIGLVIIAAVYYDPYATPCRPLLPHSAHAPKV